MIEFEISLVLVELYAFGEYNTVNPQPIPDNKISHSINVIKCAISGLEMPTMGVIYWTFRLLNNDNWILRLVTYQDQNNAINLTFLYTAHQKPAYHL